MRGKNLGTHLGTHLLLVLLGMGFLSAASSSLATEKKTSIPFKADEDLEFLPKQDKELIGLSKTEDFTGVLTRIDETDKNLRLADVYFFKEVTAAAMNTDFCKQMLEKIFGKFGEITLKLGSVDQIKSEKTGNICEAVVFDEDKAALFKERRIFVGSLHAQVYALVFRFSKQASLSDRDDLEDFVRELH